MNFVSRKAGAPAQPPSAGALYPIETYVIANDVRKSEAGVYHYSARAYQLEQLKQGELRQEIANAALGQGMCAAVAWILSPKKFCICWSSCYTTYSKKELHFANYRKMEPKRNFAKGRG